MRWPKPIRALWRRRNEERLRWIEGLLAPVNARSHPNLHLLRLAIRDVDVLALNVKALGYELARTLAAHLPPTDVTSARAVGLSSKLSTQADIESEWVAHWCRELAIPRLYHRKLWELAYILQALHDGGHLRPGARGLGFGCGREPIASYLATHGVTTLVTDLAPDAEAARGWRDSNQHVRSLDEAFHPHLVDRQSFERHVFFRAVDMNAIPHDLSGFDFCWSSCAFEHLGSIERGLAFVKNALATLRPGGTAVHTTEFNIDPDGPTIDDWPTVLFQRRHIEALAERLREQGHHVATLDFDAGDKPLDRFIDMPPWDHAPGRFRTASADLGQPLHLKVSIDGFVATCLGLIVTKSD